MPLSCLPKVMLSPMATTIDGSLSPKSAFESSFEQPAATASSAASASPPVLTRKPLNFDGNMGAHYSEMRPA